MTDEEVKELLELSRRKNTLTQKETERYLELYRLFVRTRLYMGSPPEE